MFKRKFSSLVATLTLVMSIGLLSAVPVFADDARDFTVVNNSSSPVTELWVAQSDSETWGEQILSSEIEAGGGERMIVFPYPAPGVCLYWVHAAHADGSSGELRDLNLCEIFVVTITDTVISAS